MDQTEATQPPATVEEAFPDLRSASNRTALVQAKRRIANIAPSRAQALAAPESLARLLPDRIDDIEAASVTVGPRRAGDQPISVVSRMYQREGRQVYVKVSDISQAVFMRTPLEQAIDRIGGPETGFAHGRIIAGNAAVLRYFPEGRSSQLTALVDDHYIVDVRVNGATNPADAMDIFLSLPLKTLRGAH